MKTLDRKVQPCRICRIQLSFCRFDNRNYSRRNYRNLKSRKCDKENRDEYAVTDASERVTVQQQKPEQNEQQIDIRIQNQICYSEIFFSFGHRRLFLSLSDNINSDNRRDNGNK